MTTGEHATISDCGQPQAAGSSPMAARPPSTPAIPANSKTLSRIDPDGRIERLEWIFGRPQGLTFDAHGVLHVVEALAGSSGVYALRPGRPRELVVSGPNLVGLAFGSNGTLVVTSNDTLYGFTAGSAIYAI